MKSFCIFSAKYKIAGSLCEPSNLITLEYEWVTYPIFRIIISIAENKRIVATIDDTMNQGLLR